MPLGAAAPAAGNSCRWQRDWAHNAVRDMLSHLVVQNGVINAAVVDTRLTAAYGSTFDADVAFFDPSSGARVILEVSIVAIGSETSLRRGA